MKQTEAIYFNDYYNHSEWGKKIEQNELTQGTYEHNISQF